MINFQKYRLVHMDKRTLKIKKKTAMIPIARLIQEANDLYLFCKNDKKELVGEGLDWNDAERLPVLLNECTNAEVEYQVYKDNYESETVKLKKFVLRCRKLRRFIAEKLRLAIASTGADLKIPSYKKSWSRVELIQDLNDLAVIGKDNKEVLQPMGFEMSKLDLAANMSIELSEKIVDIIISNPSESPQKKIRDKIILELSSLIARIRNKGKSTFIDNPLRRKAYACEYFREINVRRKQMETSFR